MPRWYNILTSVGFVGTLLVFAVGTFVDIEGGSLGSVGVKRSDDWDQRAKAEPLQQPGTYEEWISLPKRCSEYVDDHFGFRYSLVRLNRKIYRDVFKDSDAQNMLLGKDGWRFLKGTNSVVEYTEHRYPLSQAELGQIVSAFTTIDETLRELDIPFFIAVAPNKHSVYPEMLPDFVTRANTTRFDQVRNQTEVAKLFPFDLRQVLRDQKSTGQLFEQQGTHWTDLGAWLGFQQIMNQVEAVWPEHQALMPNVEFADAEQGPFEFGDKTELLPVSNYFQKEAALTAKAEELGEVTAEMTDFQKRHLPFRLHGLGTGHVVIFRDSFLSRMVPFLATQFETIDLYWQTNVDLDLVSREQPDLVILEFAERHLMHPDRFGSGAQ